MQRLAIKPQALIGGCQYVAHAALETLAQMLALLRQRPQAWRRRQSMKARGWFHQPYVRQLSLTCLHQLQTQAQAVQSLPEKFNPLSWMHQTYAEPVHMLIGALQAVS